MDFSVLELGRTEHRVGDRLLIVIDDVVYTVACVPQTMHVGDTAVVLGTAAWSEIRGLFPWLEEQETGTVYLRYPWLQAFLKEHVRSLFQVVPERMIIGIPPKQAPGPDPQWCFYPAGTSVLTSEYVHGVLVENGNRHRVRYERYVAQSLGDLHEKGWRIWTNRNGTVVTREVPDKR